MRVACLFFEGYVLDASTLPNEGERDDDELYPLLIGGRGDEDGYETNQAYQVLADEPTWDVFGDNNYNVGKWQAQAEACFVALVGR